MDNSFTIVTLPISVDVIVLCNYTSLCGFLLKVPLIDLRHLTFRNNCLLGIGISRIGRKEKDESE